MKISLLSSLFLLLLARSKQESRINILFSLISFGSSWSFFRGPNNIRSFFWFVRSCFYIRARMNSRALARSFLIFVLFLFVSLCVDGRRFGLAGAPQGSKPLDPRRRRRKIATFWCLFSSSSWSRACLLAWWRWRRWFQTRELCLGTRRRKNP